MSAGRDDLTVCGTVTLWLLPVAPCLAVLLFAAHWLRAGHIWLAAALAAAAMLLWLRSAWLRAAGAVLLTGAGYSWAHTASLLVQGRIADGADWVRPAIIMGAVIAFTGGAMLLLLGKAAARRYSRHRQTAGLQVAACLMAFALLWAVRHRAAPVMPLLADRFWPGAGWVQMLAASVYAAWVARLLYAPASSRVVRPRIWALFSAVFFGQLALGLLGADMLLMTGNLHLPVPALIVAAPLFRGDGFFMLGLFGVSVLLLGPAWCSHLCYVGAWDDRCSRLAQGAQAPVSRRARVLYRGMLAGVVFGGAVLLRMAGASSFTAATAAVFFGLCSVGVMVYFSRRAGRMVHCSVWCPLGMVAALAGRISPWRMRVGQGCTQCGACMRVCRYSAITPAALQRGRPEISCTLCRDCTAVCRPAAMQLTLAGMRPDTARAVFSAVAASLHAVFLVVARM